MILIQVDLPHLCAGVVAKSQKIVRAAPILAFSVGKTPQELATWVMGKGGTISVVRRYP